MLLDISQTFSDKKIIKNKLLNLFGHHLIRVFLAKLIFKIKKTLRKNEVNKSTLQLLDNFGYCLEKKFLNNNDFKILKHEIKKIKRKIKPKIISGPNYGNMVWKRYDLSHFLRQKNKNFLKKFFLENPKFEELIHYAEGKNYEISYVFYDEMYEKARKRKFNEIERMHRDTFYDTFKGWFYLNDVENDTGPFTFIKSSHKLTIKKIFFEYFSSIFFDNKTDSFNLDKNDYYNNLKSKKIITKKNSFLLANTFCFHKKSHTNNNKIRKAINFNFRKNPFILN